MLAADVGIAVAGASSNVGVSLVTRAEASTTTLVFIDQNLKDVGLLTNAIVDGAELVLLNDQLPLFDQMSSVISSHRNVGQIHVVTHGDAGAIVLGEQRIDETSLDHNQDAVRNWSASLTTDADILLYGCNTGQGESGISLMRRIAALTGADVAASDNTTGSAEVSDRVNDRDWELEVAVGSIQAPLFANQKSLDRYQHTLDIRVTALGATGEENFDLLIDGQRVQTWNADTNSSTFVYETDESISVDRVRVAFTNDVYQPELNFDRNLTIDKIEIDGQVFESEDQATFSTGTWVSGEGIVSGFGRGDTLHGNGYFQYGGSLTSDVLFFNDELWNLSDPSLADSPSTSVTTDETNQDLTISGTIENTIWRTADVVAGEAYRLEAFSTLLAEGQTPAAAIGVDFYDVDGIEISEVVLGFDPQTTTRSLDFVAPEGTSQATAWAWVGGSPDGERFDWIIDFVSIQSRRTDDVTPPQVRLANDEVTYKEGETPSFALIFTDDATTGSPDNAPVQIVDRNQLIVTNALGEVVPTVTFTGGSTDVPGEYFELYGLDPQADSYLPGTYSVRIGEGFVADQAGNFAAAQQLGSFTLQEQVGPDNPEDVTAPTGQLNTAVVSLSHPRQDFTIEFNDSETRLRFNREAGASVIVQDANGNEVESQGIAGGNAGDRALFELRRLIPSETGLQIGTYTVTVEEGYVIDGGDNVNPRLLLGLLEVVA